MSAGFKQAGNVTGNLAEPFSSPRRCAKLHEQGFRLSLWQQPYVLKGTDPWKEAVSDDYLAKSKVPFIFCGQFEAAPIDFTNPEAARWYQERLLKPFLK